MRNEIQFLLYSLPEEQATVQVVIKDETIWCTQKAMAQLFGVGVPAISKHLKNIFSEGELDSEVVISILETTTQHGAIEGKTQTSTESNSSFASHFAASCSFSTSSPDTISAQKQSIERWNVG